MLDQSEFNIITHHDILPNNKLQFDQNISDPDYLFNLPVEFGGTLNTDSVVKSKD